MQCSNASGSGRSHELNINDTTRYRIIGGVLISVSQNAKPTSQSAMYSKYDARPMVTFPQNKNWE